MSRKLSKHYNLLRIADVTAPGTFTSGNIDAELYDNVGLQAVWDGSADGTFDVQGSLDDGTSWTSLDVKDESGAAPVASGSPGSLLIRITAVPYPLLRVIYTNGSGTGALLINLSAKMV